MPKIVEILYFGYTTLPYSFQYFCICAYTSFDKQDIFRTITTGQSLLILCVSSRVIRIRIIVMTIQDDYLFEAVGIDKLKGIVFHVSVPIEGLRVTYFGHYSIGTYKPPHDR